MSADSVNVKIKANLATLLNKQLNQPPRAQAELLQSDSNDVYEDVEITFNNSYSNNSCDGKTDEEATSENDDENNIGSFNRRRPCSTKTPAPSPTSPPISVVKSHHSSDQSNNSPGPSTSSSSTPSCSKNLFANLSWNSQTNSSFSNSPESTYQNEWSKFNNQSCSFPQNDIHSRSMSHLNGHNHSESDVSLQDQSYANDVMLDQHEYCGKIRTKKKLWSTSKACHTNAFGLDLLNKKLRNAANLGDVELVKNLLDQGADACSCDARSRTSLHFAACKGEIGIAQLLLEHGADPNLQDVLGNTPLHLAACTNNTSMVTLLLKYGTDVTVLDKSGRTPLHLAESKLKILQSPSVETVSSPTNLKMQVLQVIEMIQIYLQRSGKHAAADALGKFTNRLHSHQTKQEVDMDVQDLLASLNHMSLG